MNADINALTATTLKTMVQAVFPTLKRLIAQACRQKPSGTEMNPTRRLTQAAVGVRKSQQNTMKKRGYATSNAHQVTAGTILRAKNVQNGADQPVYFSSAVRLLRHLARIRQPAISGQRKHQTK